MQIDGGVHSAPCPTGDSAHFPWNLPRRSATGMSGRLAASHRRHARAASKPCQPDVGCGCHTQADCRLSGAYVHRHHHLVCQSRSRHPLSRGAALAWERGGAPMKRHPTMVHQVKEYLLMRRSLGFKMKSQGEMLLQFAKYLDRSGHRGPLTTEVFLRWANLPKNVSRSYRAKRL